MGNFVSNAIFYQKARRAKTHLPLNAVPTSQSSPNKMASLSIRGDSLYNQMISGLSTILAACLSQYDDVLKPSCQ